MRSLKYLIWVAGLLFVISSSLSSAAEGECDGFDDLSPDTDLYLGSISKSRVYFTKTSLEDESCPSLAATCRQKAYVIRGDQVIASTSSKGFVCAAFISSNQRMALGWLPADVVVREAAKREVRFEDWLGNWQFDVRAPRYHAQGF